MGLRIAIGRCSCRATSLRPELQSICAELLARLDRLQLLSFAQLSELEESQPTQAVIDGKDVTYNTYRRPMEDGRVLIIVQAVYSTWRWPTFLSVEHVGHVVAEGFIAQPLGEIEEAPDDILWEFR